LAPPHRTRTDLIVVVAVGLAGLGLVAFGGVARWVGVAAWLAMLPELRSFPALARTIARVAPFAPYLLVGALFIGLFRQLLLGEPPASRDHGIHYFQTHLLVHELVPDGRLWGWSDAFNNGYPFGENYPTLGYLLTGAAHLLSFEAVPLRTSYAWGIAAVWLIGAIGVWWLAALIAREAKHDRFAAWAGAIGASLWLLDAGASRQGGWNYAMFHGVWPQQLSAALWVLSIALAWQAFLAPTVRRVSAAGLVLGASVLAHPFGLIAAATSAGGTLLALVLRREPNGALRTWAAVHLVALASCAWWLAAFFGSAVSMERSPVPWRPLGRIAIGGLTGELFEADWAWLTPLFLFGAVAIVRRGGALALLCFGLVLALLVLAANEALTLLRLDLVASSFKNLQFPRYAIELKPVMFAIGGFGALGVPAAVRALTRNDEARPSRGRRWLLALLIAPFVTAAVEDVRRIETRPIGAIDTIGDSEYEAGDEELLAALQSEAASLPEGVPMRVAFLRHKMSSGTFALFAITDARAHVVIDGHVPAVNFRHQVRRRVEGYRRIGVTHVVYDRELGDDEKPFERALVEVGRYGRYRLARFDGGAMPHAWLSRELGELTATELDEGGLDVDVALVQPPTKLTLLRAPHVRWRATWKGEPVELAEAHAESGVTHMQLAIDSPGKLELRYFVSPLERVAGWASVIVWAVGVLALASGAAIRFGPPLLPVALRSGLAVIVVAIVPIMLVAIGVRQDRKLQRTWTEAAVEIGQLEGDPELLRDLVEDDAIEVEIDPEPHCDGMLTRDVLSGCSDVDLRPHVHTSYRDPYLYRCLEIVVPPSGTAELRLGEGGHDVVGFVVRRDTGRNAKHLKFGVGRERKKLETGRRDFHVSATDNASGVIAVVENGGSEPERVCVAAAEIEGE
jgi:hypothetical protein